MHRNGQILNKTKKKTVAVDNTTKNPNSNMKTEKILTDKQSKKLNSIKTIASNKQQAKKSGNHNELINDTNQLPTIKKMERANSFFLTRKLSKIYNSLTSSKDSLNKIPENDDPNNDVPSPFKFIRSASLATIPLRRSYRQSNTMRESKLEQLREEDHNHGLSPNESLTQLDQSINDNCSEINGSIGKLSTLSIDQLDRRGERKNSFSLMSSLKRTFSVAPAKRKSNKNLKWSASLMSLQQIDIMISYEDLSFIDYDKFNTYETTLNRHLSQREIERKNQYNDINRIKSNHRRYSHIDYGIFSPNSEQYFINFPEVKRRKPKSNSVCTDHFDSSKNVYRQSLDDDKLNEYHRKSFRWSNPYRMESDVTYASMNNSKLLTIQKYDKINDANDCVDGIQIHSTANDIQKYTMKGEKMIQRYISTNSLRRAQSMNDVNNNNNNNISNEVINRCHLVVSNQCI